MKRTEPLVHGRDCPAVIALEVFMVKVVKVAVALDSNVFGQQNLFKSSMAHGCVEDCKLELIKRIQRVQS